MNPHVKVAEAERGQKSQGTEVRSTTKTHNIILAVKKKHLGTLNLAGRLTHNCAIEREPPVWANFREWYSSCIMLQKEKRKKRTQ
jgi:hypothetical protein